MYVFLLTFASENGTTIKRLLMHGSTELDVPKELENYKTNNPEWFLGVRIVTCKCLISPNTAIVTEIKL